MDYLQLIFPSPIADQGTTTSIFWDWQPSWHLQRSEQMFDLSTSQPTLAPAFTFCALVFSILVLVQVVARYASAYWAAPQEVAALVSALSADVFEDAGYDGEMLGGAPMATRGRLRAMLRQIEQVGDDLWDDVGRMMASQRNESKSKLDLPDVDLRPVARLLWAHKRAALNDRVRRLELLRVRFLVLYLSTITRASNSTKLPDVLPTTPAKSITVKNLEEGPYILFPPSPPLSPFLQRSIRTEAVPPMDGALVDKAVDGRVVDKRVDKNVVDERVAGKTLMDERAVDKRVVHKRMADKINPLSEPTKSQRSLFAGVIMELKSSSQLQKLRRSADAANIQAAP